MTHRKTIAIAALSVILIAVATISVVVFWEQLVYERIGGSHLWIHTDVGREAVMVSQPGSSPYPAPMKENGAIYARIAHVPRDGRSYAVQILKPRWSWIGDDKHTPITRSLTRHEFHDWYYDETGFQVTWPDED